MRLSTSALTGLLASTLLIAGCAHHSVTAKAFGPTPDEAQRIANAQLVQKQIDMSNAKGKMYHLVGEPHYKTETIKQVDGSELYEVTAKQSVASDKK